MRLVVRGTKKARLRARWCDGCNNLVALIKCKAVGGIEHKSVNVMVGVESVSFDAHPEKSGCIDI